MGGLIAKVICIVIIKLPQLQKDQVLLRLRLCWDSNNQLKSDQVHSNSHELHIYACEITPMFGQAAAK